MKTFALALLFALPVQAGTHTNLYPYMDKYNDPNALEPNFKAPLGPKTCWVAHGSLRCITW